MPQDEAKLHSIFGECVEEYDHFYVFPNTPLPTMMGL